MFAENFEISPGVCLVMRLLQTELGRVAFFDDVMMAVESRLAQGTAADLCGELYRHGKSSLAVTYEHKKGPCGDSLISEATAARFVQIGNALASKIECLVRGWTAHLTAGVRDTRSSHSVEKPLHIASALKAAVWSPISFR